MSPRRPSGRHFHRFRHSLKWRLVGLFLLLALGTTVTFVVGVQQLLRGGWQVYARPIVADYADRLAAEIDTPPSVTRAQALAERLPLTIRIDGPQVRWRSAPEPPQRHWDPHEDDAQWPVRQLADGHRITFGLARPPIGSRSRGIGWITLGALLLLSGIAFAVVRHLLRPLDDIRAGVLRFGHGDFAQPIVPRRRDELGELAEQINTMAARLHAMLEAKRALLLAISHELRSPLTRARVNLELIEESEARDALMRDLAEMRDLIGDLLESERLSGGHAALQAEAVDFGALVAEATAEWPEVELRPLPELPPLQVDAMRMRLLLRNLIGNAVRHGGLQPPPVVGVERDEHGGVCLRVRDHGPGVDAEHLPHLAEAFYRADAARRRATGGVGLGLYLCRLVAEAHGGTLSLRNAQPGLEAVVQLPAARLV